jgi:uncharacterized repeat protein (TIGR01451 family)
MRIAFLGRTPGGSRGQPRSALLALVLLAVGSLALPAPAFSQQPVSTCQQLQATPHTALIGQGNLVPGSQTSDSFQVSLNPGDKLVCTATVNTTNPPPNQDDPFWNLIKTGQGGQQSLVGGPGNNFERVQSVPTGTYQNTTNANQSPVVINAGIDTGSPQNPKGASYNLSCTCTPAPQVGTVKITKTTSGGAGTFNFSSTEATVIQPGLQPFVVANNGSVTQTFNNVPAGTFSITEAAPSGFDLTSISCSAGNTTNLGTRTANIDLSTGETVECTFTNTKQAAQGGTITIIKQVNGTDKSFSFSGTGGLGNFSLSNNMSHPSGVLAAGSYTVTEGADADYTLDTISCQGDADNGTTTNTGTRQAVIDLDDGENITCTFTNSEKLPQTGSVTIRKVVNGPNKSFAFTGGLGAFNLSNGGTKVDAAFGPGPLTVTETPDPDYTLESIVCTGDPDFSATATSAILDVDAGEVIDCTFTNTIIVKQGALTITKSASPQTFKAVGDVITYTYKVTNSGQTTVSNVSVTDDKIVGSVACVPSTLTPGDVATCTATYTITAPDLAAGSVTNTAFATGDDPNPVQSPPVTVIVKRDDDFIRDRTKEVIKNFLYRRADQLL